MVATDGRRLALVEHEVDFPKESEADIILPSKAVSELIHTLEDEGELKIHQQENQIDSEWNFGRNFGWVIIDSIVEQKNQLLKQES